MAENNSVREHWSSSLGFILAAAGSAIGLGNIWKFPYITGENGGGAFVLIYLLCITVVGAPVMLCEFALGRHTQRNPVGAFKMLNPPASRLAHLIGLFAVLLGLILLAFREWGWGAVGIVIGLAIFRYGWVLVGALGVLAGFAILSFYSVVAGWTIGYLFKSITGAAHFADVAVARQAFGAFVGKPVLSIGCHALFMASTMYIVYHGIRDGIERWSKILMPVLFGILIVLITRALTLPGAASGVRFYLSPDFSKLSAQSILIALGHAFFSLSLGMGAMLTYGSYMQKNDNIFGAVLSVVVMDTLVALMAGLALFPAVFAKGFDPAVGPGLVFQVLPVVFAHIPFGPFWAAIFFLLLYIAALTSAISLMEVVTAYFVDERRWPRHLAVTVWGSVIFAVGCLCAVSVDNWDRLPWLRKALVTIFGSVKGSFFDVMDHLASNWMLPLGGLFISLFVGWVWGTKHAVDEIRHGSHNFADVHLIALLAGLKDDPSHNSSRHPLTLASLWGIFIRFISPVAVLIAFLNTIGWLDLTPRKAPPAGPPAAAEQPAAGQPPQ
jgi:NSS family neurotransmitter:Na+ symporter